MQHTRRMGHNGLYYYKYMRGVCTGTGGGIIYISTSEELLLIYLIRRPANMNDNNIRNSTVDRWNTAVVVF